MGTTRRRARRWHGCSRWPIDARSTAWRAEQAAAQRESRYAAATANPPVDVVADAAILREERRRVAECLGSLTDAQRECIELAYYGGLTYVQVSERLSANLATIKSRMRDALRGLRNCLSVA